MVFKFVHCCSDVLLAWLKVSLWVCKLVGFGCKVIYQEVLDLLKCVLICVAKLVALIFQCQWSKRLARGDFLDCVPDCSQVSFVGSLMCLVDKLVMVLDFVGFDFGLYESFLHMPLRPCSDRGA